MQNNDSFSSSHPIQAVIFDLAGTVIDFGSCAPAGSFVNLFESYHVQATLAQAREPMGLHKRDHIRTMLSMPALTEQWQQHYGRMWTEQDIDKLYQDFIPLQLAALPHYSTLIPGACETVAQLQDASLRVGVSTGYNREMLEMVLRHAEEQGLVPDAATCGGDVPTGRPAPWMIFRLMEQLEVYPPKAVVKVGDTLADIEAGLNAEVWSVGVTQTGNMMGLSEEEFKSLSDEDLHQRTHEAREAMLSAGAHYVIDSVTDLPVILQQIQLSVTI